MMRLLRLFLLATLLVTGLPAVAACCDESAAGECCGPGGDCPTLPGGGCALSAAVAMPAAPVTRSTLETTPPALAPAFAPLAGFEAAPAAPLPRTPAMPRHLALQHLRN